MFNKALPNALYQEQTTDNKKNQQDYEQKLVLNVKQLAKIMGICEKSAYNLMRKPGFPSFKAGGRVLVNGPEFRKWMDS